MYCESSGYYRGFSTEEPPPGPSSSPSSDHYSSLSSIDKHRQKVLITVQNGKQQFKVHKTLLTSISPVFKAMFDQTGLREARENRVEIPDLSGQLFEAMLLYLYQGNISATMDSLIDEMLVVADRYQIEPLKFVCEKRLASKVCITNVIDLYQFADQFNAAHLKSVCVDFASEHSKEVKQTEQWKQLRNGNRLFEDLNSALAKRELYFSTQLDLELERALNQQMSPISPVETELSNAYNNTPIEITTRTPIKVPIPIKETSETISKSEVDPESNSIKLFGFVVLLLIVIALAIYFIAISLWWI